MISRPPLFPFVATLFTITLLGVFVPTPLATSHHPAPSDAVLWWTRLLAPLTYATQALTTATYLHGDPLYNPRTCRSWSDIEPAWQTIRQAPVADSVFQALARADNPTTRILALAGLVDIASPAAPAAITTMTTDSALLRVLATVDGKAEIILRPLASYANNTELRRLAGALQAVLPECAGA